MRKNLNYWTFPAISMQERTKENDINALIKRVCQYYTISEKELKSNRRLREYTEPRQICMYIIHKHYNLSCTRTAQIFNKNHATVLYASNTIEGYMQFDKEYKQRIEYFI